MGIRLWEYSCYTALSCFLLSLQFWAHVIGNSIFRESSVLSLKTKRNIKWPRSLSRISITGSVQQVERCSHPVGPFSTASTAHCQELWQRSCLRSVSVHSICVNSIPWPCWQSATVCLSHHRPVAWFTVWGQCHKSSSAVHYIHLCHKIGSLFTLNCVPQVTSNIWSVMGGCRGGMVEGQRLFFHDREKSINKYYAHIHLLRTVSPFRFRLLFK